MGNPPAIVPPDRFLHVAGTDGVTDRGTVEEELPTPFVDALGADFDLARAPDGARARVVIRDSVQLARVGPQVVDDRDGILAAQDYPVPEIRAGPESRP